ncbi:MAG: RsmE family RNA methyltransferase [Candidatus Pseudoruminococcus sp.]|uniref:RsmE family RNA methyltransferase n=1 Tax=Candidatus Pseudoruminococcus sp. TaxID=3101048 RepID=UPI002A77282C|nr:16S rRNA (uracil(1498)-N(3))-methyltransferase [Ruminococcus sp.]MDY2782250.1 RsmE family RNA methyltransferase [Candidatus Pseudoruminococcus sp.]
MDWFFAESVDGEHLITGEDAIHITKSLRKSVGEAVILCDSSGVEHNCLIDRINDEGVLVHEISKTECQNEPSVEVTLFSALTKGDKLETVIQKSVELGISHIVPVLTSRCVSRPDAKSATKKQARYQKIALQAAMQSRRAIIPDVSEIITLEKASKMLSDFDTTIFFFEGGGKSLKEILSSPAKKIAIFTGPEGGFEEREVELLTENGAVVATLGKRILRAETAPIAALAAIMFETGNLE